MPPILQNNLMAWVSRDISMFEVRHWRKITLSLILLAIPLFFVGGVSSVALDIYRRLWDMGHSVFFALLAINLVWWSIINNHRQFFIACVMVFSVSLLIEKLQSFIGRDASWFDVLSNMSGFLLGYSFIKAMNTFILVLRLVAIAGLLPGCWAVLKSLILMLVLWHQFPVLSGGDSSWESAAWGGRAQVVRMTTDDNPDRRYSINFSGQAYQSANLRGFLQSWDMHQKLILQIENPSNEKFVLTLRISDRQHELSGQEYNDRFNRSVELLPGWNNVDISVDDIRNAPLNRQLNLQDLYVMKLFLPVQGEPKEIYLNRIYLQ